MYAAIAPFPTSMTKSAGTAEPEGDESDQCAEGKEQNRKPPRPRLRPKQAVVDGESGEEERRKKEKAHFGDGRRITVTENSSAKVTGSTINDSTQIASRYFGVGELQSRQRFAPSRVLAPHPSQGIWQPVNRSDFKIGVRMNPKSWHSKPMSLREKVEENTVFENQSNDANRISKGEASDSEEYVEPVDRNREFPAPRPESSETVDDNELDGMQKSVNPPSSMAKNPPSRSQYSSTACMRPVTRARPQISLMPVGLTTTESLSRR